MLISKQSLYRLTTGLALVGFLTLNSLAAPPDGKGGGKGGGGEDPPTLLPDIAFEVTFLPIGDSAIVEDMNEDLQIVGWTARSVDGVPDHDGFLYDHGTGMVMTLEDLVSAEDLASLAARGFTMSKFRGINDAGILVGYVGNTDYSIADGLIIDTSTGSLTLTSSLGYEDSYLLHINNSNDLVGGYLVGDVYWNTFVAAYDSTTQVATLGKDLGEFAQINFRSRLSETGLVMLGENDGFTSEYEISTDSLISVSSNTDGMLLWDVDSSGMYVGSLEVSVRKNKVENFPLLFDPSLSDGVIWQSSMKGAALRINDPSPQDLAAGIVTGDILFAGSTDSRDSLFLQNAILGELSIDALLDPSDPDSALWLQFDRYERGVVMTEKRSDTNFGAISGSATFGLVPYLLVPKPYDRP